MNIIAEYDSSVANAPPGFKAAVNAAISYLDQVLTNPISVKLMFSYGEIDGQQLSNGALGESSTNGYIEPYSQVVSWLTASATSQADHESINALPITDPTNGAQFWVSDAEAAVFGQSSNPNFTDPEDGFVGLSSTALLDYDPTNRAQPGEYDAVGILEHEITEALGRISYLGQATFGSDTLYAPMDLFRYSGAGVHDLANHGAFFSVDGQHMLLPFNNPNNGGDGGDWALSVSGDSFEAFSDSDSANIISPTDLLLMDVLGFAVSSPARDDFNDDQKSDFLMENTSGAVVVGELNSQDQASFAQVSGLGPEWSFKGSGDFFGDGNTGFLIENTSGSVAIGEVVGSQTTFTTVSGLGPEWTFEGTGDFLGNSLSDYLIENTHGSVYVGEVGSNHQVSYTGVASLGPEWKFVGVGDFFGDGLSDFVIENTAGSVALGEVQNGAAVYTTVASLGPEWKFVGDGDFLGLGVDQFLIENSSGVVVDGHVEDGTAVYTTFTSLGPEWKFVGTGDFLGEGHDQFLIENSSGSVDVGDWTGGHIHFTAITSLGPEWSFHL